MTGPINSKESFLRKSGAGQVLSLIGVLTLAALLFATQSTLWDRDEPRFARIACEMLESGQWHLPILNGEVFARKPPLTFWAMAGSMALFGVNTLAVRIPAVLSLAATGWLVFLIGRRLFSACVGFWATAMLMSSAMPMYLGSAAMLDATLMAFISLAMWAHVEAIHHPQKWWAYWPVLTLAVGLSELTKHPVGIGVIAPATLLSTWFLKEEKQIPKSYWLGLLLALAGGCSLYAAWFIPVQHIVPGFVEESHGRQIIDRLFTAMEGHGADSLWGYLSLLPFYIPVIIAGFVPWSVFLPAGVSASIRGQMNGRTSQVIIWSWILPVFLMFSLAATKLPHYILPAFPAMALLAAGTLEAWRSGTLQEKDRFWLRSGAWFLAPVVLVGAVIPVIVALWMGSGIWRFAGALPGLLILISGLFSTWLIFNERILWAARTFLIGMPVLVLLTASLTLPAIEPLIKVSPVVAQTVRSHRSPDEPVAMCGYAEPSLLFYLNLPVDQPVSILERHPMAIWAWLKHPGPGWLVTYDSLWQEMLRSHGPAERAQIHGEWPVLNTNDRARRDTVKVIERLP